MFTVSCSASLPHFRNDCTPTSVALTSDYLGNACSCPATIQSETWGNLRSSTPGKWTAIVCAVVCVHVLLSLLAPRGFALTAFGDILQNIILLVRHCRRSFQREERLRQRPGLFWALMGLGLGMWLASQVMWTYIEVYLRHEAPNPFVGDVILFLHIVPMMAAVAVQPHVQQDDRSLRVGTLDFALLFTWWLFLYLFVVIPWQYVHPGGSCVRQKFRPALRCRRTGAGGWLDAGVAAQPRSVAQHSTSIYSAQLALLRRLADGQRGHRFASLLHGQSVRRAAGGGNGMVCADRVSCRARAATQNPVDEVPSSRLRNLEGASRDGGRVRYAADGGMGAIRRRCAAERSHLPTAADRRSDARDGRAGISQAAFAGSGIAQPAAICRGTIWTKCAG